jgi:hypothetical protein
MLTYPGVPYIMFLDKTFYLTKDLPAVQVFQTLDGEQYLIFKTKKITY